MIKSFRNKALADLWSNGRTAKIDAKLHKRILIRLDAINKATRDELASMPRPFGLACLPMSLNR